MRHVIEEIVTAKQLGKQGLPLQAVSVLLQVPAGGALRAGAPGAALELLRPTGPTGRVLNPVALWLSCKVLSLDLAFVSSHPQIYRRQNHSPYLAGINVD